MGTSTKDAREQVLARKRVYRLARTDRLREHREAVGLSQSDVARIRGVSPSTVSRWEAAKFPPRGPHAVALIELLELDGED